MPEPKHRRRADKRPDEILDAALACFTEKGFASTRVEDIAKRADISKATVYLYFKNKIALLEGLVRRAISPIPDQAGAAIAAFPGTVRQTLEMFVTMVVTRISDPKIIAIPIMVMRESTTHPELANMYRTEVLEKGLPIVKAIIQKGVDSGEFRTVDPEMTARSLIGPVLVHLILSHVFGVGDSGPDGMKKLMTSHLDILMNGLEAR